MHAHGKTLAVSENGGVRQQTEDDFGNEYFSHDLDDGAVEALAAALWLAKGVRQ